MNLAQLIDPEWARQGALQRHALVRPAQSTNAPPPPEPQVREVVAPETQQARRRRAESADRQPRGRALVLILGAIERICAADPAGASFGQIVNSGVGRQMGASGSICNYYDKGYLERTGKPRLFRYRLTPKGLTHLRAVRGG